MIIFNVHLGASYNEVDWAIYKKITYMLRSNGTKDEVPKRSSIGLYNRKKIPDDLNP